MLIFQNAAAFYASKGAVISYTRLIAKEIRKYIPDFKLYYDVDLVKQRIADSWPDSLDYSEATRQWGFEPKYDLAAMTKIMLEAIENKELQEA